MRKDNPQWMRQDGGENAVLRLRCVNTGEVVELRGRRLLAGRRSECDLCVEFHTVSRRHAEFLMTDTGWILRDLGSKNGTAVNGVKLMPEQSVLLRVGDEIAFAKTERFFVLPPAEEKRGAAHDLNIDRLQEAINDMYPGIAMFVRDVNLADGLADKYQAGSIIRERAFTDASCRIGGLVTTHRYVILSNHMGNLSAFEHGTHWGLHVAQRDSHFKVFGVFVHEDKTAIVLLHLPDDPRWKLFENVQLDIDRMLMEKACERFVTACGQPPIPELANAQWLDRCVFPLGMNDRGEFWPLE